MEASLDIDFDMLFTEMCSCDSLLQRMGRCNRAARYLPINPNVVVYDNENGVKSIYDPELYQRSLEFLKEYTGLIFTEKMKTQYIENVYKTEEIRHTVYYKEIEEFLLLFSQIRPLEYSKQEADEKFRLINSITVVPDSIYDLYCNLFEEIDWFLKQPHIGREARTILKAKLNSLTLSISLYPGKFPEGVDHCPIKGTDIYRTQLKYEFDSEICRGRGLLLNEMKDESCFI